MVPHRPRKSALRLALEPLEQRTMLAVSVVDRHVFYNGSVFDGNDPLPGPADDAAVATDKSALLPGQAATVANYTSYGRGINGIMVDLIGFDPSELPDADQFQLNVGNDNGTSAWRPAPDPASVSLRRGEGTGGSDRVTLIWPDGAIRNQWLQVLIPAGGILGLDVPDEFYFGNAVGDSGLGNQEDVVIVDAVDRGAARDNPRNFLNPAAVDFPFDYNRDGLVNAVDRDVPLANPAGPRTGLQLLDLRPTAGLVVNSEPVCHGTIDVCLGHGEDTGQGTVYLHNGAFHLQRVDLVVPGRGFDWMLARSYRSDALFAGPLGFNWTHNYDRRLLEVTPATLVDAQRSFPRAQVGDVLRLDGYNRADLYVLDPASGGFTSPAGFFSELVDNFDESFTEWFPDGSHVTYRRNLSDDPFHRMVEQADRNDNRMTFLYDPVHRQLATVIDTMGRQYDYFHNGPDGQLSEVVDYAGRTVRFNFDPAGDLVAATSPGVVGTPGGNDFPQGKTEAYSYSSGFENPLLNHNLLTVTAPNEVATGGPPRIVNSYGDDPASVDFDRVRRQDQGGVNYSEVPAGGTTRYFYEAPPVPPTDPLAPAGRTTVLDPNGNATTYDVNGLGNILAVIEVTNRDVNPSDPDDFVTVYEWNADYQLERIFHPEGNITEFLFDRGNPDRRQQGNLLAELNLPDAVRGGDQEIIVASFQYEPIFNQVLTVTEARGNDPNYQPQNGGPNFPERYQTVSVFDYQEAAFDVAALAGKTGRGPAEIQQLLLRAGLRDGLGDVNGDGSEGAINGNSLAVRHPTVRLLPDANHVLIEGGPLQPVVETFTYNLFGQVVSQTDPEGNVDLFSYYRETDPDGDSQPTPPPLDGRMLNPDTGGYLRSTEFDVASLPIRNSQTNPPPVGALSLYQYDAVGNMTGTVEGRGIATEVVFNALNQVVEVRRATQHGLIAGDPPEPTPLVDFDYLERLLYDANDNLVLHQVEDRGNTSGVDGNPPAALLPPGIVDPDPPGGPAFVDTVYRYDILDQPVLQVDEVGDSFGLGGRFLATEYRYDANRNPVLTILPEGNAAGSIYDERDLLFRSTTGATTAPPGALLAPNDPPRFDVRGGIPAESTYLYDGNRNLIQSADADDTDLSPNNNYPQTGTDRTRFVYDGFDRLTSVIDSVGSQSVVQYDPAGNVVRRALFGPTGGPSPNSDGLRLAPGPVSQGGVIQPGNLVNDHAPLESTEYGFDELSRAYQTDRLLFVNTIPTDPARPVDVQDGAADAGKGNLTPGDGQPIPGIATIAIIGRVTTRTEYDRNSRPTFIVEDDEDTSRVFYDGADRVLQTLDPVGNTVQFAYDDSHNLIETFEMDLSQAGGPTEVFLTTYFYDSLNRLQTEVDNLGHRIDYRYDSRDNLVAVADAAGPVLGNAIARRAFPGVPGTVNTVNEFGNVTLFVYDGLSRLLLQRQTLTDDGQGDGLNAGATLEGILIPGPPPDAGQGGGDGLIHSLNVWDDNSLLTAVVDDSGNATAHLYDNLNRRVAETKGLTTFPLPLDQAELLGPRQIVTPTAATINNPAVIPASLVDSQLAHIELELNLAGTLLPPIADLVEPPTTTVHGYDPDGNLLIVEDENDSELFFRHDAVNRGVATRIFRQGQPDSHLGDPIFAPDPAADPEDPRLPTHVVVGTTQLNYEYDGLGRLTRATDDNDPLRLEDDSLVTYAYDSLSRVIEETQQLANTPPAVVSSAWRAENLRTGLVYPGGLALRNSYDRLDRLGRIFEVGGGNVVQYNYVGASRVQTRLLPNSVMTVNHDGDRRPAELIHQRLIGGSTIVGFDNQFDRMDNRLREQKLHDPANSETYAYDSAYRLVDMRRDPGGIAAVQSQWKLDGVGNWSQVDTEGRGHNSFNEMIGSGVNNFGYDNNGNQTGDGRDNLGYQYDALNRLREVDSFLGGPVAGYSYDALGRRVRKTDESRGLPVVTDYLYDGPQVVEEIFTDEVGRVRGRRFVYGVYVDEPLRMDNDLNGDGVFDPNRERFYYHQNSQSSTLALTNPAGQIVEGYLYDAYGRQTVYLPGINGTVEFGFDDLLVPGGASAETVENPYLFTGRRLDAETNLYYYRDRFFDSLDGRFLQRDPAGFVDGLNLYQYAGGNPATALDPTGQGAWNDIDNGAGKFKIDIVGSTSDSTTADNGAVKFKIDIVGSTSRSTRAAAQDYVLQRNESDLHFLLQAQIQNHVCKGTYQFHAPSAAGEEMVKTFAIVSDSAPSAASGIEVLSWSWGDVPRVGQPLGRPAPGRNDLGDVSMPVTLDKSSASLTQSCGTGKFIDRITVLKLPADADENEPEEP